MQATRGLYEALPIVLEEAREKPVAAAGGIGNGEGIDKRFPLVPQRIARILISWGMVAMRRRQAISPESLCT